MSLVNSSFKICGIQLNIQKKKKKKKKKKHPYASHLEILYCP